MGCGVSRSVLDGNDDVSKSDVFLHLCTREKNPIAVQLNAYFNAIISECLYKSQGDMNGYERLLAKRPTEITVNRSKLAAQRHGIGHKPLTLDGVNDIMTLFLGHVIHSLERRKWSGSFNYALLQPMPDISAIGNDNSNTLQPSTSTESSSPQASTMKKSETRGNCNKKSAAHIASVDNRSGDTTVAAADPPADSPAPTTVASSRKSNKTTVTTSTSVADNSSTLVFVDRGNGSRQDDNPSRQWRMELTGNITYPSVDGALTLICDCKVSFLFFTCDTNLPPVAHISKLSEDLTSQGQNTPLHVRASPNRSAVPVAEAVESLGPVMRLSTTVEGDEGQSENSKKVKLEQR
jgi:hypothetical protein